MIGVLEQGRAVGGIGFRCGAQIGTHVLRRQQGDPMPQRLQPASEVVC